MTPLLLVSIIAAAGASVGLIHAIRDGRRKARLRTRVLATSIGAARRCRLGNVVADLHEHFHNKGMCQQRIVWNACRRLPCAIASWIDSLDKRFKGSVGTGGVQPVATGSGEPRGRT
jgi:hypothetical protein